MVHDTKTVAFALILLFPGLIRAGQAERQGDVSLSRLGNVLYCLRTELARIDYAPPRASPDSYVVRYILGVEQPGDRPNELHLVVYDSTGESAILYEVYFEKDRGRSVVFIGEMGTLKKGRDQLEPDEIPGGVGTYYRIRKLLKAISARPEIRVPVREVHPGPLGCRFVP